jgi:hypothetical protein
MRYSWTVLTIALLAVGLTIAWAMGLLVWVAIFVACNLFCAWVLFWGGAESLEGSFLARLLIHQQAPRWSAQGIKLYLGLSWVIGGICLIVAVVAQFCG